MRHTKIIFLDIDGVLLTSQSYERHWEDNSIDPAPIPTCVDALNSLVEQTGAGIVITSSHRADGFMPLKERLRSWGVRGPILGMTPFLEETDNRGMEIQKWIDSWPVELECFVILEDREDLAHLSHRQVKTYMSSGFLPHHCDKALAMLRRSQNP